MMVKVFKVESEKLQEEVQIWLDELEEVSDDEIKIISTSQSEAGDIVRLVVFWK